MGFEVMFADGERESDSTSAPGRAHEGRACGECDFFRVPGGCHAGVCTHEVARFCDERVENMPKWFSVDATIDWVLENLRGADDAACERFKEYAG